MILPTVKQMDMFAPGYLWHEPDYTNELWKYDPKIALPWDSISLKKQIIEPHTLAQGISIRPLPRDYQSTILRNEIEHLVGALGQTAVIINVPPGCRATFSLADIARDCAVKKIVIIVEQGAQVTCIDESTLSLGPELSGSILATALEIHVHQAAHFEYCEQQRLPLAIDQIRSLVIIAHADSTVIVRSMRSGGGYGKTFAYAHLIGSNANVLLQFGALMTDRQYQSIITEQHHTAPYTLSRAEIKFAQYHSAQTMYDGRIILQATGTKSEALQQHQALLMNAGARAYARPTLEAKTNDLQCGHGSAIGIVDQEQLWYLQSRGITQSQAEKVLVTAFLKDFYCLGHR